MAQRKMIRFFTPFQMVVIYPCEHYSCNMHFIDKIVLVAKMYKGSHHNARHGLWNQHISTLELKKHRS